MINITDVSAVDRLIDFYGDNCQVIYKNQEFYLDEFRDFCVDEKISLGIDLYQVDSKGIKIDTDYIVIVSNLHTDTRDNLI